MKYIIQNILLLLLVSVAASRVHACYSDPLLIDLGKDGVNLGEAGKYVYFDFMGDGNPISVQWVAANGNEAFLVRDHNGNGLVDSGQELFGDNIARQDNPTVMCTDGFDALAQFDVVSLGGNGDGRISSADSVWTQLLLWNDLNADGQADASEMSELADYGITALQVYPKQSNRYDSAGNWIPLWGWVKSEVNGKKVRLRMVDVVFKIAP